MSPRPLFVATLALAVACHRSIESAPQVEQPAAASTETVTVQQIRVRGRVVRDGVPLASAQVRYGIGEADADVSDEAGEFELVLTDDFARAPAIFITLTTADGQSFREMLPNSGRALSVTFDVGHGQRVELHDASPEEQAWLDVHAWAMREFDEWMQTPEDDHEAHLAQWARVAEAIADEPEPYRRGLMAAAQFQIGRSDPKAGLDRSEVARAAIEQLGLEDPRWSISPFVLATAVFESGRWAELAPQLDELITRHPQPEVAGLIALERYVQTSADGPAAEAAAVWQRWIERPALARTPIAPVMAAEGPKRLLAPGQRLPDVCVEDLAGGPLCLADLHGRMVVLEIWAIGCKGCREAIADLQAAHAALTGDEAPQFVSVSAWDEPEPLIAFLRDEPMPWRHGWVRESERDTFQATLGFQSVPTVVLIDAEGTIVASSPELRTELLLDRIETLRPSMD